jgi:hypothetical protein
MLGHAADPVFGYAATGCHLPKEGHDFLGIFGAAERDQQERLIAVHTATLLDGDELCGRCAVAGWGAA